ncbi:MAG: radical SAM protein [Melioribacteraceae bacterium]|nr:MAG: radical SAM protein [Melioribacteraceae bacterium]
MKVLLIVPPFTQLNSPYPSVTKLSGFLNNNGISAESYDLSLETFRVLFSRAGLTRLFDSITELPEEEYSERVYALRNSYINVIDEVIAFLDGSKPEYFRKILSDGFLPKNEAFSRETDLVRAFGEMGEYDRAKHFASLLIEDLTNFIRANVSPNFGLSRYAEKIATSSPTFAPIKKALRKEKNIIEEIIRELTIEKIESFQPQLVGYSIPFPGNLLGAMISSENIKNLFPNTYVVYGGGYINTELRKLKDPGIFEFTDFITLDEGEMPLLNLIHSIQHDDLNLLVRTYLLNERTNKVEYIDVHPVKNLHFNETSSPDIGGLNPERYVSLTELLNPMHRMWSDGYWNKLTLAHGCYWAKCTFCDVNLDYIGRYSPAKAVTIVDWMEDLIEKSGRNTFHFTDEAAPPALLRDLSLELLKRGLHVTWWGNIRFEKAFTPDLCKLMSAAGCIAVSGGLEVADERLLKLIDKGVTIAQVANACSNFKNAGIMVHAYLMYGFPTQTAQESIDSLEYVRQFMEMGLIDSGFWHLFTLTDHSPVAADPEKFRISIETPRNNPFANNDLIHTDEKGTDHERFSEGLRKAIYNYMNGNGIDWDVRDWFDFSTPKTRIRKNEVKKFIEGASSNVPSPKSRGMWIAATPVTFESENGMTIVIHNNEIVGEYELSVQIWDWLEPNIERLVNGELITFSDLLDSKPKEINKNHFFNSEIWQEIRTEFLLFV